MEHQRIATNGVTLHVALDGPEDGPLVVLLHGFPEFWWAWRRQIEALAGHGFRVAAPDQRGYAESDKPRGLAEYTLDVLAQDVVGLIDALGRERAQVVGHDWGAAVAWWTAARYPSRVERMVALNTPHPGVLQKKLLEDPRQLRKSWYMFFFQLPLWPEAVFVARDGARMCEEMSRIGRGDSFSDEDLLRYREAWRHTGAPRGMLSWYRAALKMLLRPVPLSTLRVRSPAMIIWGEDDALLEVSGAEESLALCDRGRLERVPGATHWVHHEEPQRVNDLLLEFLAPAPV